MLAILPLLTVLFVGLKLGHIIFWSWFLVLTPVWIVPAIIGAVVIGSILVFLLIALFALCGAGFALRLNRRAMFTRTTNTFRNRFTR